MRVAILGCRGSTPVSGSVYSKYGCATSCLALSHGEHSPTLVLDAGTGLMNMAPLLGDQPFRGTILLTHLHWDHTHGLPFFRNAGLPGHRVQVAIPAQGPDSEDLLARAFSPPHFPVRPSGLGDGWTFLGIEPGAHEFEGFSVVAEEIPHKGGRTFGYRVSDGRATLAYLPDHSPLGCGPGEDGLGAYHPAALALAAEVDLLIHDAQHTAAELPSRAYLGHSAIEYALGLGEAAGAREVALFHHDPSRTDAELDAIAATYCNGELSAFAAREGMQRRLGERSGSTRAASGATPNDSWPPASR